MKLTTFDQALSRNVQSGTQISTNSENDVQAITMEIEVQDGLVLNGPLVQKDAEPHWFEIKYSNELTVLTVRNLNTGTGTQFELIVGDTMPQELISALSSAAESTGMNIIDLRTKSGLELMKKVLSENEDALTIFNTPVTLQMETSAE